MKRSFVVVFAVVVALAFPAWANETFNFSHIPGLIGGTSDGINGAIGEAQLSVTVSDAGNGQVLFTFNNTGPSAARIDQVYFEQNSPLASFSLIDVDDGVGGDSGVDFSPGALWPTLPGGWQVGFEGSRDLSASADLFGRVRWPERSGVDPGESLGMLFDLKDSYGYGDVTGGLGSGDIRIGLRVNGFAKGCVGESFVTCPANGNNCGAVPAPGAVLLGGIGIGIVGWLRRRRTI